MAPVTRKIARVNGMPLHGPLPPPNRAGAAAAPLPTSGGLPINAALVAQKTRRDNAAHRIPRRWRFRLESRGIERPNFSNTCYQNTVQQVFMHQPPFLEWILTHNSHTGEAERIFSKPRSNHGRVRKHAKNRYRKQKNGIEEKTEKTEMGKDVDLGPVLNRCSNNGSSCFACEMKGLAIRYWDRSNPPFNPILWANEVQTIAHLTWGTAQFPPQGQADATEFYSHCIETMRECTPADPAAAQDWENGCSALYDIVCPCTITCSICNTSRGAREFTDTRITMSIEDPISSIGFNDISSAIHSWFEDPNLQVDCPNCGGSTRSTQTYELFIAPIILRINLSIFMYDRKTQGLVKSNHAPSIPGLLDLRRYQADKSQPLRYKLSSVIGHDGDSIHTAHYISAVRGPQTNMRLDDDRRTQITAAQLTANPHAGRFACYELTYIRG